MDWNTKTAKVEFDENALPAQKIAQTIASHAAHDGRRHALRQLADAQGT